jgi:hypothetical protein
VRNLSTSVLSAVRGREADTLLEAIVEVLQGLFNLSAGAGSLGACSSS